MNIVINRIANSIEIDGVSRNIDLSGIPDVISYVKFNTVNNSGFINHIDISTPDIQLGKQRFDALFSSYIRLWKMAGPVVERTLDEVKTDKRQQINSKRDSLEQSGFPYLGKVIDSNPVSVQRISIAAQAAQFAAASSQPFSIDWTCQDNSILTLTADSMIAMPVALAMFANSIHHIAREKKALIDAAITIAEVNEVIW